MTEKILVKKPLKRRKMRCKLAPMFAIRMKGTMEIVTYNKYLRLLYRLFMFGQRSYKIYPHLALNARELQISCYWRKTRGELNCAGDCSIPTAVFGEFGRYLIICRYIKGATKHWIKILKFEEFNLVASTYYKIF